MAENSTRNPVVNMSKFFDLWSKSDVALGPFDEFYYAYLEMIRSIENECGMKVSEMKAVDYNQNESLISQKISEFNDMYHDNDYFIVLLKDAFDTYLTKKNKGTAQTCLKENKVYGVITAYRLFYVGCSRARKNLAIVIYNSDIAAFKDRLKIKFEDIGFGTVEF